jgi:predicted transglutaminase-like cysteine proteinase
MEGEEGYQRIQEECNNVLRDKKTSKIVQKEVILFKRINKSRNMSLNPLKRKIIYQNKIKIPLLICKKK